MGMRSLSGDPPGNPPMWKGLPLLHCSLLHSIVHGMGFWLCLYWPSPETELETIPGRLEPANREANTELLAESRVCPPSHVPTLPTLSSALCSAGSILEGCAPVRPWGLAHRLFQALGSHLLLLECQQRMKVFLQNFPGSSKAFTTRQPTECIFREKLNSSVLVPKICRLVVDLLFPTLILLGGDLSGKVTLKPHLF